MTQQINTSMTVMWSNIKIFKNSKWRTAAVLENIGNAITRLVYNIPIGTNLGGRIHPTPLPQNRILGILVVTANRTVNVRVLWGSSVRCPAMDADHPLLPEWHDNQQRLADAEFCRAAWKDWVDCKRRTANGREFQSVMVRGKNEYLKTSVVSTNWQWHKFIFVGGSIVCRDETKR